MGPQSEVWPPGSYVVYSGYVMIPDWELYVYTHILYILYIHMCV